ncbi:MAG: ribbon-helix-helix domain-containing protein [Alphaproteobacteria bacterium]
MPKSVTIGARISEELDADLRKLAAATGRSKSRLVAEAVSAYVSAEKELAHALDEGLSGTLEVAEALKQPIDFQE